MFDQRETPLSDFEHDIHKYNDEFDALASLIGYNKFSEDTIISLYKHGLNLQYFREVYTREAESLKEAIRIAVNYSIKREQSRAEINRTANHNKWKGSKYEKTTILVLQTLKIMICMITGRRKDNDMFNIQLKNLLIIK